MEYIFPAVFILINHSKNNNWILLMDAVDCHRLPAGQIAAFFLHHFIYYDRQHNNKLHNNNKDININNKKAPQDRSIDYFVRLRDMCV